MDMKRVSVLQTHSGAQMWISQSHCELMWLHFLSPQDPRARDAGVRLGRLRQRPPTETHTGFHSADTKTVPEGNSSSVEKKRLLWKTKLHFLPPSSTSSVEWYLKLHWMLNVDWLTHYLNFHVSAKEVVSHVIISLIRQDVLPISLSFDDWVSSREAKKSLTSLLLGFCWKSFNLIYPHSAYILIAA